MAGFAQPSIGASPNLWVACDRLYFIILPVASGQEYAERSRQLAIEGGGAFHQVGNSPHRRDLGCRKRRAFKGVASENRRARPGELPPAITHFLKELIKKVHDEKLHEEHDSKTPD